MFEGLQEIKLFIKELFNGLYSTMLFLLFIVLFYIWLTLLCQDLVPRSPNKYHIYNSLYNDGYWIKSKKDECHFALIDNEYTWNKRNGFVHELLILL